jgi:hypothetical protein
MQSIYHPVPKLLEAQGTIERALLGWLFFGRGKNIMKTVMFRDMTTVLNESKHLEMVIRSVPDSVSLILGRTAWPGLTALHRAKQLKLFSR